MNSSTIAEQTQPRDIRNAQKKLTLAADICDSENWRRSRQEYEVRRDENRMGWEGGKGIKRTQGERKERI